MCMNPQQTCQAKLFRVHNLPQVVKLSSKASNSAVCAFRAPIHIKLRSGPSLTDSWVIIGTDPETIPLIGRALAEVARAYDCPRLLSERMTSVTIYFKISVIKLLSSSLSEPIYPDVQLNARKVQWILCSSIQLEKLFVFFSSGRSVLHVSHLPTLAAFDAGSASWLYSMTFVHFHRISHGVMTRASLLHFLGLRS